MRSCCAVVYVVYLVLELQIMYTFVFLVLASIPKKVSEIVRTLSGVTKHRTGRTGRTSSAPAPEMGIF